MLKESVDQFGIPLTEEDISDSLKMRIKAVIKGACYKIKHAARTHDVVVITDLNQLERESCRALDLKYVLEDVDMKDFNFPTTPVGGFKRRFVDAMIQMIDVLNQIKEEECPRLNVKKVIEPFLEIKVRE